MESAHRRLQRSKRPPKGRSEGLSSSREDPDGPRKGLRLATAADLPHEDCQIVGRHLYQVPFAHLQDAPYPGASGPARLAHVGLLSAQVVVSTPPEALREWADLLYEGSAFFAEGLPRFSDRRLELVDPVTIPSLEHGELIEIGHLRSVFESLGRLRQGLPVSRVFFAWRRCDAEEDLSVEVSLYLVRSRPRPLSADLLMLSLQLGIEADRAEIKGYTIVPDQERHSLLSTE